MSCIKRDPDAVAKILASFQAVFIPTIQSRLIEDALSCALAVARHGSQMPGTSATSIITIESEPNCGLSSTVRRTLASGNGTSNGASLYVDVSVPCTPSTMTTLILAAAQDRCAHQHDEMKVLDHWRILQKLDYKGIKMIVFDNLDRGFAPKQDHLHPDTAGWFSSLLTATSMPVVLMGRPGLVESLGGDPRSAIRSDHQLRMNALDWSTARTEFYYVLGEFGTEVTRLMNEPTNLTDGAVPRRMHDATAGVMGTIARLLRTALRIALLREDGADRLTEQDLHEAFQCHYPDKPNPFLGDDAALAA